MRRRVADVRKMESTASLYYHLMKSSYSIIVSNLVFIQLTEMKVSFKNFIMCNLRNICIIFTSCLPNV